MLLVFRVEVLTSHMAVSDVSNPVGRFSFFKEDVPCGLSRAVIGEIEQILAVALERPVRISWEQWLRFGGCSR